MTGEIKMSVFKSTCASFGLMLSFVVTVAAVPVPQAGKYQNPVTLRLPGGGTAESCADPSVIKGAIAGDHFWYLYCTTDPMRRSKHESDGKLRFHNVPMFRSADLVRWDYVGDAFPVLPDVVASTGAIWAPEVRFINGHYIMYFVVTDAVDSISSELGCDTDSAIGVAVSDSPVGPWKAKEELVIAPRRAGPGCSFKWTYDPRYIVGRDGRQYLYFGSYGGGIFIQPLTADGFSTTGDATRITVDGRYEASEVVFHNDMYYLIVSTTNCCNGPLTGYALFVGRSSDPLGPFRDREGHSMLDARVGGTPLLVQNGNRWVGPGHNTVFEDGVGQSWTMYHAIDSGDPYLDDSAKLSRRPVLLDKLDWIDDWPVINNGDGPSDTLQLAPVTQLGQRHRSRSAKTTSISDGNLLWSENFKGTQLDRRWRWVRPPKSDAYGLDDGVLRFDTQAADLYGDRNDASVLVTPAPAGDYIVEARVRLILPDVDCCQMPVQAGIVIYDGDDNYIKLVHVALNNTRQIEFASEILPTLASAPRYGNTVLGPPADLTWLRIAVRRRAGHRGADLATAFSSHDGINWVRGGTWQHVSGAVQQVGLVSMGGGGFSARFETVRILRLKR